MRRFGQLVASAAISVSLIATSTAAVASNNSVPAAPSTDSWVALSMLTPSGTALLDSTALAAAQPDTVPPPPPPPRTYYTGPSTPPIPVIILWLAVLGTMVYIATKNNHNHPVPNSPA
jgi:hypothetical protein